MAEISTKFCQNPKVKIKKFLRLKFWRHYTQHNDNDIHHNNNQHSGLICDTRHKWTQHIWHSAKQYRSIECHYAECHVFYCYAECRYAECRYAECRYAECRYAECRGAKNFDFILVFVSFYFISHHFCLLQYRRYLNRSNELLNYLTAIDRTS